jgi:hypothetical protein
MTLPEASVTSPVIPHSVCCAATGAGHSAAAAANASSRENEEMKLRMKYPNLQASDDKDLPR